MPFAALRRITERIQRAWLDAERPSSAAPAAPQSAVVSGRLDLRNTTRLRNELFTLLDTPGRTLALDLSGIAYLGGCALAVLVEFARAWREAGRTLRVIATSQAVRDTFSLFGLYSVLAELSGLSTDELDGFLVIVEDEFAESIRLPAVEPQVIEEDDYLEAIELPPLLRLVEGSEEFGDSGAMPLAA